MPEPFFMVLRLKFRIKELETMLVSHEVSSPAGRGCYWAKTHMSFSVRTTVQQPSLRKTPTCWTRAPQDLPTLTSSVTTLSPNTIKLLQVLLMSLGWRDILVQNKERSLACLLVVLFMYLIYLKGRKGQKRPLFICSLWKHCTSQGWTSWSKDPETVLVTYRNIEYQNPSPKGHQWNAQLTGNRN